MASSDAITVDMYYDSGIPMLMAPSDGTASGGTSAAMTAMVGGHGKEIAIGALAMISLFMISTIVKKGTPAPVIAQRVEPRETPRIGTVEDIAGVVGNEGPATLDGMELDEDAIRAQQMVEQVSTMVKEDPDGAANLVKRWLNRS
jgi:flagellar biosynthesis/type III secretory pathway M-ring protein FliF/YscJ